MTVRIEKQGEVWTVIHFRPEAKNAMDPESAVALEKAFLEFDADPEAAVAVLWGEGGAFCSGFDLKHAAKEGGRALEDLDFPADGSPVPRGPMGPTRLVLDKPVIAAIAGPAVAGGFEIALWCDLRVMEESAYFGVYCRRWGVPLIDGGTVRLPRIVGRGRALDLILTGRKCDAAEASRIGLADRIAPHGESRRAAEALALEIARFPEACMRADRRSVYLQEGQPLAAALRGEWRNGIPALKAEGITGAARFASGKGRGGSFSDF
jgi:enoyl-CoA hydratase/carnithine racemase